MKFIRKLYDWVLSLAESKHSNWALFLLAFAESSFFPVPPDVLLIGLDIGKPKKSFFYATICTAGSVIGGIFGYFIGYAVWQAVKDFFFRWVFSQELFTKVQLLYQQNAFWAVFTAGFTPIPYKVFTIAGGVCEIGLAVLILASVLSRGARFFIVSFLIWQFGESVKKFIDRYFNWLTILFVILLLGGFIVLKKVSTPKQLNNTKVETERKLFGDYYIDSSIGDASYLNPVLATDSASNDINSLVFNGLVKYDKNINIIGDLAESWTVSADGKTIIFNLRENVKWHDGKPFTAEDVEFTYQKLIDPKVKTPYSSDFELVKKFEVINPYKVKITYKEPFSPGLISWGMGIIPQHIFSAEGRSASGGKDGDFNNHPANRKPIGTGPYKFVEWKTDEKITLVANPDYFEGPPKIQKYIYRIIPDQSVQFLELRNETIDTMGLTPDQYNAYPSIFKNYNKFRYPSFGYTYLGYNLLNPLFKEKKIRQAIAYSINKKEIIDGILLGYGVPATGPFPPTSWAYNPDVKDYEYNPEKAKKIFNELGWKENNGILTKNGKKFEFTIITNQGNKSRAVAAELIQAHLKNVGIKVNIRILEWSTFIHQYIDKKNFDAVILGWALSRDPDQYPLWHSSQQKEGQYNFISYKNKEVDKLLDEGRRIFSEKKRQKIYRKIHQILAEDQPYTFLYVADSLPVIHKRFIGPEVAPLGIGWNFREWYVPKEKQKYLVK